MPRLSDGPDAVAEYVRQEVGRLTEYAPGAEAGSVEVTDLDAGIMNYVYRVEAGGRTFFLKQALDRIRKPAGIGADLASVPPSRIRTEARALTILAEGLSGRFRDAVPTPVWFDAANNVLWTAEVGARSHSLQAELLEGRCRRKVARRIGRLLGAVHSARLGEVPPLWEDDPSPGGDGWESDRANWERFLAMRTVGILERAELDADSALRLRRLQEEGRERATEGVLCHLDAAPKNVLVCPKGQVGLLDFELGAAVGDLAYDPGFLIGHYLAIGVSYPAIWPKARRAIWALLAGYWETGPLESQNRPFAARAMAYAAATMLYRVYGSSPAAYLPPARFPSIRRLALRILARVEKHSA